MALYKYNITSIGNAATGELRTSGKRPGGMRTIVFYDGGCGMCSREIRFYSRLDDQRRIKWINIGQDTQLLNALGVPYEAAMRRLHVLDREGALRTGADAFLTLWSELPYFNHLTRLVYATRTAGILERLYRWFAERRYRRRVRHAQSAAPGACPAARDTCSAPRTWRSGCASN